MPGTQPTTFYMHIMKTAGTSLVRRIRANFDAAAIYPNSADPDRASKYWRIEDLRALDDEARGEIRLYHGHLPFVAAQLVEAARTLTVFRDPVERTISALHHCRRHFPEHHGQPLEAIYEDPWRYDTLLSDYQVKQLAFIPEDSARGHVDRLDVNEWRFAIACQNLERLTTFGLAEALDEFAAEVEQRFGWRLRPLPHLQRTDEPLPVPGALRRRIAHDNAADVAFYDEVKVLYQRRRARSA